MRLIKLLDAAIVVTCGYAGIMLLSYFMGNYTAEEIAHDLFSYITSMGVFLIVYFTIGRKVN